MAGAVLDTPEIRPADAPPAPPRTVIVPPAGWQWVNVGELWRYRELLFFLAWRDVKVRYKQTALGAAWAVLQPAMMMGVFFVFFGRLAGLDKTGGVPYPMFALSGLLPWFLFTSAVTAASNSVLGSERLITKTYFPRLAVPFAAVAAAAVDFLVACGLLTAVAVGYAVAGFAVSPGWNLLLAPLFAALVLLLAAGLGTLVAALNVGYRDFKYVVPFLLQLGLFATPTVYMQPTGAEGGVVGLLMTVNPMTGLVAGFRAAAVGGEVPWSGVLVGAAAAVAVLAAGCAYFRKVEDRFADVI